MNAPKLTINVQNTIALLASTFSNSTIFINELMQNARRAGASTLKFNYEHEEGTLLITDNGKGIDNFSDLLTIGQSGWDERISKTESPYGAGFLSAIMAAERGFVESNGKRLDWVTEDLIKGGTPTITTINTTNQTVIGLNRIGKSITNFGSDTIRRAVIRAAAGFPTETIFNGTKISNPDATNERPRTSFTKNYEGLGSITFYPERSYKGVSFYLQGLPICSNSVNSYSSPIHRVLAVHLDPVIFKGRMPDRTELLGITRSQLEKRIEQEYFPEFAKQFFKFMEGDLSLASVFDFMYEQSPSLLKDAVKIPGKLFKQFHDNLDYDTAILQGYDIQDRWSSVRYSPVTKDSFDSSLILVNSLPDETEDRDGTKALFLSRLSDENEVTFCMLKERNPSRALLPSWVPCPLDLNYDTCFDVKPNEKGLQTKAGIVYAISSCLTMIHLSPEGYEVTLMGEEVEKNGEVIRKPVLNKSLTITDVDWYDHERDILIICSDLDHLELTPNSLFKQTDYFTESEYDGSDHWDWDEVGISEAVKNSIIEIKTIFGDEEGANKMMKEAIHSHLREAMYRHSSEMKDKKIKLTFCERGFLKSVDWE